jgi:hypothetical protein
VTDLSPLGEGKDLKRRLINFDIYIFGKLQKTKDEKDKDEEKDQ